MKVLVYLCACIAASSAGIIGYPVAPLGYPTTTVFGHPFAYNTIARPVVTYPVHHLALPPSYFSYNVIPGDVIFPGVPDVFHYLPIAPTGGKGKTNKKKPGDKKDDKGTKEETTEAPKEDEESESKSEGETEDLAQ